MFYNLFYICAPIVRKVCYTIHTCIIFISMSKYKLISNKFYSIYKIEEHRYIVYCVATVT